MPPVERDLSLLWDMLEACRAVGRFIDGYDYPRCLSDEVRQAAVERKVQIIGEAVTKLSREFKSAHSQIDWVSIAGQRHVLVHDYGRIQHDRIWDVASRAVPELQSYLEPIVSAGSAEECATS